MRDLARLILALANGLGLQAFIDPGFDARALLIEGVNRLLTATAPTLPGSEPCGRSGPS